MYVQVEITLQGATRFGINWHSNLLGSLNPVPIRYLFFYFDPFEDVEVVSGYRDQPLQVGDN